MKKFLINGLVLFFIFGNLIAQITQTSSGNLDYEDTIKFNPLHIWISINDPEINIWEVGKPNKVYFNSSHSGDDVIITDTGHYYPNNLKDYFYITIPWSSYYWEEGILSFYHMFDTDTLIDGGIIEVSYDNGNSWINIIKDTDHITTNFIGLYEDTIKGGNYGFSGHSKDWQYVEIYWFWVAVALKKSTTVGNLDTPIIRFKFISDTNNTSKEGWMIDDIVFRGYSTPVEIQSYNFENFKIFPNPSNRLLNFSIKNTYSFGISLILFDMSGKMIRKEQLIDYTVDISDLKSGIYLYKILDGNNILKDGKLIKN